MEEEEEYLRHLAFGVTQVFSLVHCQTTSSTAETVSLWSELTTIALLAEQVAAVFGGICAVQSLVAKSALEALLVPLAASCKHLLGRVDRLVALGALWLLWHLERHFELFDLIICFSFLDKGVRFLLSCWCWC